MVFLPNLGTESTWETFASFLLLPGSPEAGTEVPDTNACKLRAVLNQESPCDGIQGSFHVPPLEPLHTHS